MYFYITYLMSSGSSGRRPSVARRRRAARETESESQRRSSCRQGPVQAVRSKQRHVKAASQHPSYISQRSKAHYNRAQHPASAKGTMATLKKIQSFIPGGSLQIRAVVASVAVCALLAVPVFKKDGSKSKTRQGHDYFSQERPEAIRAGEEERRRRARRQQEPRQPTTTATGK